MAEKITSADIDRVLETPKGAIEDGREYIQRLKNSYGFADELGHPLVNCRDFIELEQCFEHLVDRVMPVEGVIRQQQEENKDLQRELSETQSLLEAAVKREVEMVGLIKGAYAFLVYVPDPTILAITPDVGRVRENRKIEFLAKLELVISDSSVRSDTKWGGDEKTK